jgi:hypothetical protein
MKKLAMLALSAVLAFGFVACGGDDDDGLYVNSGSSRFKIFNKSTTDDVLLFNAAPGGTVRPFAGVRAGQTFGIANAPQGLWILFVVTQSEYNLRPSDPIVSMTLLVYNDDTAVTYEVDSTARGNIEILLRNTSNEYIEVRRNHFGGELFLVARPQEVGPRFVQDGQYFLFPVVKRRITDSAGNLLALFSESDINGRKMLLADVNEPNIQTLDVTPSSSSSRNVVEALIYVNNSWGTTALVQNSAGGQIASIRGRTMVSGGGVHTISRVAAPEQIDANTGVISTSSFPMTIQMSDMSVLSALFSGTLRLGYAYTLTIWPGVNTDVNDSLDESGWKVNSVIQLGTGNSVTWPGHDPVAP